MEVAIQLEVEHGIPQAVFQGQGIVKRHYSTECMPSSICNTPPHPLSPHFLLTRDKNLYKAEQITNYLVL